MIIIKKKTKSTYDKTKNSKHILPQAKVRGRRLGEVAQWWRHGE